MNDTIVADPVVQTYINYRGKKFYIETWPHNPPPNGPLRIFKSDKDGYKGTCIFSAVRNWTIEQAQKWCEL